MFPRFVCKVKAIERTVMIVCIDMDFVFCVCSWSIHCLLSIWTYLEMALWVIPEASVLYPKHGPTHTTHLLFFPPQFSIVFEQLSTKQP